MAFLFPYETKISEIDCGGKPLQVESLKSLDETIDLFFADYEKTGRVELFADLCPYFGVPWPAGNALAAHVYKRASDWQGKKVLELGCGLALPSLVLARTGIEVMATDLHPDVPEFLKRNIEHNGVSALNFCALDWRELKNEERFDVILASDVLYDRVQPEQLFDFLQKHLHSGAEFILTDPGRPYFDRFLLLMKENFQVEERLESGIFFLHVKKRE